MGKTCLVYDITISKGIYYKYDGKIKGRMQIWKKDGYTEIYKVLDLVALSLQSKGEVYDTHPTTNVKYVETRSME